MLRNGEIKVIDIIDLSHDGWGVGRYENQVVFVSGALIGDKVKCRITQTKKSYARAALCEILEASSERIEPDCKYFGSCGGCTLRNFSYPAEVKFKTQRVKGALYKAAKVESSLSLDCLCADDVVGYRNKTEFAVARRGDKIEIGFMEGGTSNIVDVCECMLSMKGINDVLAALRNILPAYADKIDDGRLGRFGLHHVIVRESSLTHEIMVIFVSASGDASWLDDVVNELIASVLNVISVHHVTGARQAGWNFFGGTLHLYGKEKITDCIGHVKLNISPASFIQVNTKQADILYSKALEFADVSPDSKVLDMYCGAGSLGLYLADKCEKVLGVEVVESAVEDALENTKLNEIGNAQYLLSSAERSFDEINDLCFAPDVVLLDPPRVGCDEGVLRGVVSLNAAKIVYVSCDPATMARDVKFLIDQGYALEAAQPVDMFPRTAHIECVVLMTKLENQ